MVKVTRRFNDARLLFVVVVHNHDGSEVEFDFIRGADADRFEKSLAWAEEHRLMKKENS